MHERNRFVANTVVSADARPRFADRGALHTLDAAAVLGQGTGLARCPAAKRSGRDGGYARLRGGRIAARTGTRVAAN